MTNAEKAARWSVAFRAEMDRRRYLATDLARAAGLHSQTVGAWMRGESLPSLDNARKAADALDTPRLARLIVELRTIVCAVCDREFVDASLNLRTRYCSIRCAQRAVDEKTQRVSANKEYMRGRRLALYQRVVDSFCRDCEPEGVCRDADCLIQAADLSPLPMAKDDALPGTVRVRSPRMQAYILRLREGTAA